MIQTLQVKKVTGQTSLMNKDVRNPKQSISKTSLILYFKRGGGFIQEMRRTLLMKIESHIKLDCIQ